MNYLRLLQLRRDASAEGGEAPKGAEDKPDQPKEGEKTFTQADVDRLISQTVARERTKAEEQAKAARTEAERLAKLSADERTAAEREQREQELARRERELSRRELRATALQTLAEKGLPAELADALDYADADKCNATIAGVEKAFRAAVQKGVTDRLKGSAPKAAESTEATAESKFRAALGLTDKK